MGTSSIDGGLKFDGKQSDLKHNNINIYYIFSKHTHIYTWNIIYKINGF